MALNANTFTDQTFEPSPDQTEWTEGRGSINVKRGYFKNPSRPKEEILITQVTTILNQYGHEIRRDEEEWFYELPGAPPSEYKRETYSRVWLPGIGRTREPVETEHVVYWPFTPLTTKDNLGRTRRVSAYVVYDLPKAPDEDASAEAKAKAVEDGFEPGTKQNVIVSSGRLWSEANLGNHIVRETDASQRAVWVDNVMVEEELVAEELDKWTIWTAKKNALRSAGIEWSGPTHIRKESFKYRLPVPLNPPKLTVTSPVPTGIRLEASGGGAKIKNPFFGPAAGFNVEPTGYNFYRRTVTEPPRDPDDDLFGWGGPPLSLGNRKIIENTDVKDFSGAPADPLPIQSTYTEPGDADPEPEPRDTEFQRIASVENTKDRLNRGFGEFIDGDVEDGAEYEYYATCVYNDQESSDSNHETRTYTGPRHRRYRMLSVDGGVEAVAPDDPALGDLDYGETIEIDLPTTEDPLPIAEEIADRQFAANRGPDYVVKITVLHPLLGLEWGQGVVLPSVTWEVFGNDIQISSRTQAERWMLVGFKRSARRDASGSWSDPKTELTLQERPRPQ